MRASLGEEEEEGAEEQRQHGGGGWEEGDHNGDGMGTEGADDAVAWRCSSLRRTAGSASRYVLPPLGRRLVMPPSTLPACAAASAAGLKHLVRETAQLIAGDPLLHFLIRGEPQMSTDAVESAGIP